MFHPFTFLALLVVAFAVLLVAFTLARDTARSRRVMRSGMRAAPVAVVCLFTLVVGLPGCNTSLATTADGAVDCAKAEASLVAKGLKVLDVAADVAVAATKIAIAYAAGGATAAEAALLAEVEPLIAKYGEPIVACTFGKLPIATSTARVGAGSNAPPDVIDVRAIVFAHYGWRIAK